MVLGLLRFTNALGGTANFIYPGPTTDMQSPASAGAADGTTYLYYAQSFDMSQWEIGTGAYTASSSTFARTTISANSLSTTAKINFTDPPQVIVFDTFSEFASITAAVLATVAQSFNSTQQAQARSNINAAESPANWTRTVFTSGSGTYTTPSGCKAIRIRMVGGGGGGGGGGTAPSGGAGGNGGNTTFGTSLLVANGGSGNGGQGFGAVNGGIASGGDINITGATGPTSFGAGAASSVVQGSTGAAGMFGGGGSGGWLGGAGSPGQAGSGAGGGGGGGSANGNSGAGGAGGGYCEKLIVGPSATYAYAVGSSGSGGTVGGGTNASAGGAGGSGIIIIDEYY